MTVMNSYRPHSFHSINIYPSVTWASEVGQLQWSGCCTAISMAALHPCQRRHESGKYLYFESSIILLSWCCNHLELHCMLQHHLQCNFRWGLKIRTECLFQRLTCLSVSIAITNLCYYHFRLKDIILTGHDMKDPPQRHHHHGCNQWSCQHGLICL